MINKNTVKQSLLDTLNGDVTLCGLLKVGKGSGAVFLGPDFPTKPPQRFVLVSILSSQQELDETKFEFTGVAFTIAVKATPNSNGDDEALNDITQRIDALVDETPAALTLADDLIVTLSHDSTLSADTETISSTTYLISQERYELITTAKV